MGAYGAWRERVALTPRDPALAYVYITAWQQWRWDCLDCGTYGLRSGSRYDMRGTIRVALRHNCR